MVRTQTCNGNPLLICVKGERKDGGRGKDFFLFGGEREREEGGLNLDLRLF